MRNYYKSLLLLLATLICFVCIACVPDPPIPNPEEPEPLVCDFGFEVNTVQDTCECLLPKVRIAGVECRVPNPEEFYASMEGCLQDIGIIFYYRDDSLINDCCRRIHVERPSTNNSQTQYDPGTMRHTTLPNGVDSVYLRGTSPYFTLSPDDEDRPLHMHFSGKYTNENTIEGEFRWVVTMTDTIEFRCPGVFRRQPE